MTSSVVLSSSINSAGGSFDYAANQETVTILADVIIGSYHGIGVYNSFIDSVLMNRGAIVSFHSWGILFDTNADNGIITNAVSGLISGIIGVEMDGHGSEIFNNNGRVIATDDTQGRGVSLGVTGQHATLNNHGSITSAKDGVYFEIAPARSTLNNFNLIKAQSDGVDLHTASNVVTTIFNGAGGTIQGGQNAIYSDLGAFSLDNLGRTIGNILDESGVRDVVINRGTIQGVVELQGGNDVFNGTGGKSGPIFGGDGNDRIIGGSHNDQLHGGDGNDTLTGGPGADKFFFDTELNAATNVDKITDFTPSQHDKIVLSQTDFTGIGPLGQLEAAHFHINHAGPGASPQIVYTPGNGFLYYDANGSLPGGMTHFATLTTHPVIHAADFIVEA